MMARKKLFPIVAAIAKHDSVAAKSAIRKALRGETGRDWKRFLGELILTLDDGVARRAIFKGNGNDKVPFLCWSSLPGKGFCPGAGICLTFCYSFKAWRYPAAFCRQAQNSWLLHSADGRELILADLDTFENLADGDRVDFRLYVDGDFGSVEHVKFWMDAIRARPWLKAYGYSKSWRELLTYSATEEFPSNYLMNLSSGSLHSDALKRAIAAKFVARGEFIAVDIGHGFPSASHGTREHNRELRAAFAKIDSRKAFTCPGKCGSCTPSGHACGSEKFRNIPIIIAVH